MLKSVIDMEDREKKIDEALASVLQISYNKCVKRAIKPSGLAT